MTRDRKAMPLHLFKRVLDNYVSMGGGHLSLTPSVGDIFMDPHLLDRVALLEEYKGRGINSLSVTTNAVLARKYRTQDLRRIVNLFDRFHISIYGRDEQEYATLTRRNNFDNMIKSTSEIVRLTGDSGKIRIGFRLLGNYTTGELSSWVLNHLGTAIPFQAINTYSNWGNIAVPNTSGLQNMWHPIANNTTQCFIPLLAMQVFSSGHISFCACADYDADKELSLGHILDADLLSLYNTDKVRQLWNFEHNMPIFCRHCTFHRSIKQIDEFKWLFERPLDFIGG